MSDLTKLSGMWLSKDKNGNQYFSGKFGPYTNLKMFPNTFKKPGEKSPDYYLFISPVKTQEEKAQQNPPQNQGQGNQFQGPNQGPGNYRTSNNSYNSFSPNNYGPQGYSQNGGPNTQNDQIPF